jgi:hypothetical protein
MYTDCVPGVPWLADTIAVSSFAWRHWLGDRFHQEARPFLVHGESCLYIPEEALGHFDTVAKPSWSSII